MLECPHEKCPMRKHCMATGKLCSGRLYELGEINTLTCDGCYMKPHCNQNARKWFKILETRFDPPKSYPRYEINNAGMMVPHCVQTARDIYHRIIVIPKENYRPVGACKAMGKAANTVMSFQPGYGRYYKKGEEIIHGEGEEIPEGTWIDGPISGKDDYKRIETDPESNAYVDHRLTSHNHGIVTFSNILNADCIKYTKIELDACPELQEKEHARDMVRDRNACLAPITCREKDELIPNITKLVLHIVGAHQGDDKIDKKPCVMLCEYKRGYTEIIPHSVPPYFKYKDVASLWLSETRRHSGLSKVSSGHKTARHFSENFLNAPPAMRQLVIKQLMYTRRNVEQIIRYLSSYDERLVPEIREEIFDLLENAENEPAETKLYPKEREYFAKFFIEHLTHQQIADLYNRDRSTISQSIENVRQKLGLKIKRRKISEKKLQYVI